MLGKLKRGWDALKKGTPGRRFQSRYERNRECRGFNLSPTCLVQPVISVVLLAGGIVLCVIPGPGLPLIVIGLSLLAERSRAIARIMDWTEVRLRKSLAAFVRWWRHAPFAAKNAVVLLFLCLLICTGYGAYHVVFGR